MIKTKTSLRRRKKSIARFTLAFDEGRECWVLAPAKEGKGELRGRSAVAYPSRASAIEAARRASGGEIVIYNKAGRIVAMERSANANDRRVVATELSARAVDRAVNRYADALKRLAKR